MFLPNLDGTLTNIFNALKNGGRLAVSTWSLQSKVPAIGLPMSIIMRELDVSNPSISPSSSSATAGNRVVGPFSLADDRILKDALQKTGFRDIRVERQNVTFEFASVNDYINHVKDIGSHLEKRLCWKKYLQLDKMKYGIWFQKK